MKTRLICICILCFTWQAAICQVHKHKKKPPEGVTITIDMSKDTPMSVVSNTPHIIVDPHVTISHDTAEIARVWRVADSMDRADKLRAKTRTDRFKRPVDHKIIPDLK